MQISASITSGDIARLVENALAAESGGADRIHIDIEDGVFIPSFTVGPRAIASVRQAVRLPLDVHLQTERPERWILPAAQAGADLIFFHPEATAFPLRMVRLIRESGARVGGALLLGTQVDLLLPYLDQLAAVLLMSADPEPADQFHPAVLDKACELAGRGATVHLDGGVTPERMGDMQAAGVRVAVAGRAVFGAGLDATGSAISNLREWKRTNSSVTNSPGAER